VDTWITHIGGYPGRYNPDVKDRIISNPPKLFICGHSHILKVIYDKKLNLLHINPGAAGKYGLHHVITAIRFSINGSDIKDLEILELKR
jgi:predicted phosphodiesterase